MAEPSASSRLAVYGSLAPGARHHEEVARLGGTWQPGTVRGRVLDRGWSRGSGYPGFVSDPSGPEIPVQLLTSPALIAAWGDLDRFEGREYRRVVVDVDLADGTSVAASIYELRPEFAGG